MKIIVTGAHGQLGRDCLQVLSPEHAVQPFSSRDLNITDRQRVRAVLDEQRPDLVINCAAYTAVDACENDRERCLQVNAVGPGNLAAACAAIDSRMIHISTDYVFDGNKPLPEAYTENDPVSPLSAYGMSKLAGEEAIRANMDNHLIIRTAWLYGMGGTNFLKTMLRLAIADPRRTLRVVNDQMGSLTWTSRLALQISRILDNALTGTIHATAEGYGSWFESARLFLTAMGVEFKLEPCSTTQYPTPAHRPANSILENHRLKECGLNRMVPWEEDVRLFAEQFHNELLAEARR